MTPPAPVLCLCGAHVIEMDWSPILRDTFWLLASIALVFKKVEVAGST